MKNFGQIYIISAPSGAGKSSLINTVLSDWNLNPLELSISFTTRKKRANEENGKHYYFVEQSDFKHRIKNNEFLEFAEVFGNFYGTSKLLIQEKIKQGIDVLLDIDWQGARNVKREFPNAKSIFILPPSLKILENRLILRAQDDEKIIKHRMNQAKNEISHYKEYDYLIINDIFEQSIADFKSILHANLLLCERKEKNCSELIKNLLFA